jgi:hypothetical protein
MSKVTYIKKNKDTYFRSASASISVEDEFLNVASSFDIDSNFYSNFLSSKFESSVPSGLMPPGVRAIYPGFVVFERPPRMQLVQHIPMSVDNISEHENEEGDYPDISSYYIPIPWQIYIASYTINFGKPILNCVKMFFSNEPLTHEHVKLYLPYIPNFFTNATLCAPHFEDSDEIYRYSMDIAGVVASAYDWVWNTGFNADLVDGVTANLNYGPRSNPIINHFRTNKFNDLVSSFYDIISGYTPEQIIDYAWLPPSYTSYYDSTSEIHNLYYIDSFRQDYISDTGIEVDDDNTFEDQVTLSDFSEWLGDYHGVSKTYDNIIESILFSQHNKTEIVSNHRMSYNNAIKTIPSQDNFISQMLINVRNTPSST